MQQLVAIAIIVVITVIVMDIGRPLPASRPTRDR